MNPFPDFNHDQAMYELSNKPSGKNGNIWCLNFKQKQIQEVARNGNRTSFGV